MLPVTPNEILWHFKQGYSVMSNYCKAVATLAELGPPTDPADITVGSQQWVNHVRSLKIGY